MKTRAAVFTLAALFATRFEAIDHGAPQTGGPAALLTQLEAAVRTGDCKAYVALTAAGADRTRALDFCAAEFRGRASRGIVRERDRTRLPGVAEAEGARLVVDVFIEIGDRARVATWQLDTVLTAAGGEWRIAGQDRLSALDSVFRLKLPTARHYAARGFTFRGEDFELRLERGSVFPVDTEEGATGFVLVGDGRLRFHPAPETERGQIRLLTNGSETLDTPFDAAYVRAGDLEGRINRAALTERAVDPREYRRAEEIFREESVKSFAIDLADLSSDNWSLSPAQRDAVAEVRTRRFGTLTYTQSDSAPEDISLFDRSRQRHIALYPSAERMTAHGLSYSEEDVAQYDALDYDVQASFTPGRRWIEGQVRLRLRTKTPVSQLPLRLADTLAVRSVTSQEFGRLFSVRVKGQNLLLVSLPALVLPDTDFTVTVAYGGPVVLQPPDREMLAPVAQDAAGLDALRTVAPDEEGRTPTYVLSNRSFWYPQTPFTDYATARLRLTVPARYDCVASGVRQKEVTASGAPGLQQNTFTFVVERPVRYLSMIVGRFALAEQSVLAADAGGRPLDVSLFATREQVTQSKGLAARAARIASFYRSLLGSLPYPTLSVVAIEGLVPGGHSPGYFAILSQPGLNAPRFWRNDPAAFDNQPDFFLAHEIAHQWWGQAVGWQNYHEQWLSEAFAQYFAALYVRQRYGEERFEGLMRQMRRTAVEYSTQGPVYLGYRLGLIRDDGRAFRAIVYNKGAAVLDMLRLTIGDERFTDGLRQFYDASRFKKVGTDDFRRAMEKVADRPLAGFFNSWIYGTALPQVRLATRIDKSGGSATLIVHAEQTTEPLDLPLPLSVRYASAPPERLIVDLKGRTTEVRLPLKPGFRNVEVERHSTMATIQNP
jgi:hypothetical protein